MIRYLRLWRQFVITAFMREAEYRMNFVIGVGEGLAQLALAVISFLLLYRFTDQVAGWTQAEVLMLVGVYRIVEGLINLQIAPNMRAISGYIRNGEMDFMLLRPVSSQFLVSLRTLELPEGVNVLIGLLLLIYAGGAAGVRWSAGSVLAAGAFGLCGRADALRAVAVHGHVCVLAGADRKSGCLFLQPVRNRALPGHVLQRSVTRPADLRFPSRLRDHLPSPGAAWPGRPAAAAGWLCAGGGAAVWHAPVLELCRAALQQRQQLISF